MDKHIKPGLKSFYTTTQIHTYLRSINFPALESPSPTLQNLTQLIALHLLAFPFENTLLHYTPTHEVDVHPEYVYTRLVEKRLGGTWCCGHNGLFLGILRGLGYRVMAVSGRGNESPPSEATKFTFLVHLALLVQFDAIPNHDHDHDPPHLTQTTYLVDVGYGGTGLARPIPLPLPPHMATPIPGTSPPEQHRLTRTAHPHSSLVHPTEWALQHRCGENEPWTTLYIFGEGETHVQDWVAFSQWLCKYPVERFARNVVCVRYFVVPYEGQYKEEGEEGGGNAAAWAGLVRLGRLIMVGGKVHRRVGAQSETLMELRTERERIQALSDHFGITVAVDDVRNIEGRPAALAVVE